MSRRRTSTGATSIASRTTIGLTSTFMRRSVKTNEFKTHESVSDRESRHFQRGGDFGKKAPPALGPWLDCVYSIYRRIHYIWVQLLHVDRGHAQRVCRTIPVCANPAKLECCRAFRPGD